MTGRSANAATFRVGDWTAEPAANRLVCAGREVKVEPKVMRVLSYLVERHGEVVTRHDLETHVWAGMTVTDDAVTNTVIKLRKALGDNARDPRYIETIAKSGYRLIADTSGIAASTGSACHEAGENASAVILAMGIAEELAIGSVRLTLGRGTDQDEIDRAAELLYQAWRKLV